MNISDHSEALEPFLLIAKNVRRGPACLDFVKQVINCPSTWVFGELLQIEEIREDEESRKLLELYAYGSYMELKDSMNDFDLTPQNIRKLKMLSIVELYKKKRSLPYDELMSTLDIKEVRELEDLLIDCIYAGIIAGKIDQKLRLFQVQETMGRDVRPSDLDGLTSKLTQWSQRCREVLNILEEEKKLAEKSFSKHNEQKTLLDKQKEEIEKRVSDTVASKQSGMQDGRKRTRR